MVCIFNLTLNVYESRDSVPFPRLLGDKRKDCNAIHWLLILFARLQFYIGL